MCFINSCNHNTIEKSVDYSVHDSMVGSVYNGKRQGNFIQYSNNKISEVAYYLNDSIKYRIKVFEGHLLEKRVFVNDSCVSIRIIDYESFLVKNKFITDEGISSTKSGENLFNSHCLSCHFQISERSLNKLEVDSSLYDKIFYIKKSINHYDKIDLLSQNELSHKSFIHIDSMGILNIYNYLKSSW